MEELIKKLEKLSAQVEALSNKVDLLVPASYPLRSKEVDKLYASLAKAQSEMLTAEKSKYGQYKNSYATMPDLVRASRDALTKNGLAVKCDIILGDKGESILQTKLTHSSGQYETTETRIIPARNDTQGFGSSVSYLERYTYRLVTGVAVSDASDDDGEASMPTVEDRFKPDFVKRRDPESPSFNVITKFQLQEIEDELDGHSEMAEDILQKMGIPSFADLPANKCASVLKRIRELKELLKSTGK